ncbi:MAG TPA: hypothetical protein VN522_02600 [Solirubrobacterales bacterium]|nr:hypothetical protein [Solirubrobacterales bacterium]
MNPAEARAIDSSRYPPHLSEAGFMQPCPRRIRARRGGEVVLDYAYPSPQVLQIAGMVAFYDEKVDTFFDGVPVERPRTKFSGDDS